MPVYIHYIYIFSHEHGKGLTCTYQYHPVPLTKVDPMQLLHILLFPIGTTLIERYLTLELVSGLRGS